MKTTKCCLKVRPFKIVFWVLTLVLTFLDMKTMPALSHILLRLSNPHMHSLSLDSKSAYTLESWFTLGADAQSSVSMSSLWFITLFLTFVLLISKSEINLGNPLCVRLSQPLLFCPAHSICPFSPSFLRGAVWNTSQKLCIHGKVRSRAWQ